MKKLLFFDIDGTILAGGIPGYIPESTIYALDRAKEKGHLVFINSGRTYSYFPGAVKDYPFDGYVCGCGTQIFLHGEELYHHTISHDLMTHVIKQLKKYGVQAVLEGAEHIYWDSSLTPLPLTRKIAHACKVYGEDILRDFTDPELAFDKVAIIFDRHADIDHFTEEMRKSFEYMQGFGLGPYGFGEFVPGGCSKATGIDLLVRHLGVSLDDCYVFGDGINDLPMITHVKHSVAMGNSHPEVLRRSYYVTTPVGRDGIKLAMEHFGII